MDWYETASSGGGSKLMHPLSHHEIKGNWATLLLPVNEDQSIDYARLEEEINRLIAFQVDGIYSNGTAGEFYNITEEEFDKVNLLLAKKCNDAGMAFQIGVSHMSPVLSLNRLKRVLPLDPAAVQVILPDWFKVTDEEAVDFLKLMAETAGERGLVLYNPPHAKRNLSPEDFRFLKGKVPHLVGIKAAGGDDNWYEKMKTHCSDISVFIPGHNLASGISKGAKGAYSNMACLNPAAGQKWYQQIQEDLPGALDLEKRINIFLKKHILPFIATQQYSNQAVDKCLAVIGGWSDIGSRLRWPYKWIDENEAVKLRPYAKDIIPEFIE